MRKVQIYVNNRLLDLFQDEKISIKSSVQDINDIAKVFTDFSQSFTVPASDENNSTFGYYYNNDLNEFNANVRVDCRIEIDLVPFRQGKLQLEGSKVKNNQVEAYKVSFFGDVVSLKDKFEDDKLGAVDYSSLAFQYTAGSVKSSIENSLYKDVRFPLISSDRVWEYETPGGSINDISDFNNPLVYTELFPAISDSKIMSLIASHYGVTFNGNFLTDDRFKNSYTWWKNREDTTGFSGSIDVPFNSGGVSCDPNIPNAVGASVVNFDYIDLTPFPQPANFLYWHTAQHKLDVYFVPTTTGTYHLDVYKNGSGTIHTTFSSSTTASWTIETSNNIIGLDDYYTFKVRAAGGFTFDMTITYEFDAFYQMNVIPYIGTSVFTCSYDSLNNMLLNELDFSSLAPDIKVADWFSGTLKEFNLTCYPTAPLTFQIEPLEDWYAAGDTINITEFVQTNEITVDRLKLYNDISFSWVKSKSLINRQYADNNGKEYGDLKEIFPNNDGGKYNIKLPFENIQFNNIDTLHQNLQLGYCLEKAPDYKPYIPKPIKLYLNTLKTCAFYFYDGITSQPITEYMPFGQSTIDNNATYSMNFGSEFDTLTNNNVPNSLYKTYYEAYLLNLFNSKSRKVTLKCVLPIDVLTKISLDDALIVRDKKYRINDMTTDLTTGEVQLVLISDWVEEQLNTVIIFPVPQGGGVVTNGITPPVGGYVDIADPIETKFITSVPVIPVTIGMFAATNLTITVPVNTTGVARYQTIVETAHKSDGSIAWLRTLVIEQAAFSDLLLTESGGYLLQENLSKILL